ncbi:cupin [Nitrospirillum sp. BR 11752]|uniref:cupin n=1 Tax=Nitrospirillum sp. BR 11752 TaxID=3104293 RepID=UPI002EA6E169|nr:cupin [Nitrospirillum sp. BR 11752]
MADHHTESAAYGGMAGEPGRWPENFILHSLGWVPNNARLPVLLYRSMVALDGQGNSDLAAMFEGLFDRNGWPARWRDGIYDYHHYHSTAHEVLGFARGWAEVMLGGPEGRVARLQAGDAAVLPAGTGHCRFDGSDDLLVVGGYPQGQEWDVCRDAPTPAVLDRIARVPFPPVDPVMGGEGPLIKLWTPTPGYQM